MYTSIRFRSGSLRAIKIKEMEQTVASRRYLLSSSFSEKNTKRRLVSIYTHTFLTCGCGGVVVEVSSTHTLEVITNSHDTLTLQVKIAATVEDGCSKINAVLFSVLLFWQNMQL